MTAGPPPRVGVVGLGLIGGSLARLLVARGIDVVATDVAPGSRAAARDAGLTVADDVAGAVAGRDLVVLAVPLLAMRAVAAEVARHLDPGATVTDVGSVKGPVRAAVSDAGAGDRYVGAHPMAGTERSGFVSSDAGLLDGVPWAVTVDARTDPARLAAVLGLVTGPLAGTAAVLTDDCHDEVAALVSHVPHVVATQLLNAVAGAPVRDVALGLAAGSFRDGTRVAFTDPARTEAMVTENAAWVAPALRKVARDLEAVVEALEANASVHEFFHAADDVRGTWLPGRRAARTGDVERVPLEGDWPAALVDRCAAGAVVVRLTATHAEVAR
ncbi:prephenate dehydrogenase/arogenate dehydrogenase family protein [Isoptericola variabilis]|uniref:Prephenate dehydrogenase n=1 Tax=Isoptericola variabilis (strain 225) TaxID=743718 RepID=F6FPT3_ISOV2|nr:prephenate dehydrogenase/arogenate dehydrogenase family protein [Isoptericola variabilis]AEG43722.1 Prephenate dehydrogenase [Isoptericola variabilis 225]TWH27402.1 prephenate dehydrogenase [Isoptericola variabilis J7]